MLNGIGIVEWRANTEGVKHLFGILKSIDIYIIYLFIYYAFSLIIGKVILSTTKDQRDYKCHVLLFN